MIIVTKILPAYCPRCGFDIAQCACGPLPPATGAPARAAAYATIAAGCFGGPIPPGHKAWLDAQDDATVEAMAEGIHPSQGNSVDMCPRSVEKAESETLQKPIL